MDQAGGSRENCAQKGANTSSISAEQLCVGQSSPAARTVFMGSVEPGFIRIGPLCLSVSV